MPDIENGLGTRPVVLRSLAKSTLQKFAKEADLEQLPRCRGRQMGMSGKFDVWVIRLHDKARQIYWITMHFLTQLHSNELFEINPETDVLLGTEAFPAGTSVLIRRGAKRLLFSVVESPDLIASVWAEHKSVLPALTD